MKQILITLFIALSLTAEIQAQRESLSTLRGKEAIKRLKQSGQYDSLREAFRMARQSSGETDDLLAPDAVTQPVKLTAADGAAGDRFGDGISISGDTAVVGAWGDDVGANNNQGSAYVFIRSGTTWIQQAKLTASDGAADDTFGYSVSISGDTIVAGSDVDDVGANVNQGSAYVFVRSGTTWTQQAKLTATDGAADDSFGFSVNINGETIVVGAPGDVFGGMPTIRNAAYIFVRSGATWTQQAKLTAADNAATFFGAQTEISGDTVVVSSAYNQSAYVFVRSGTMWTQQAKLTAADGEEGDFFALDIAISGNTIVVAAPLDDIGTAEDQGSAYVFVRNGTTWTQQAKLTAADGGEFESFAENVAISGDIIVAGSSSSLVEGDYRGAAYVFVRNGAAWTQRAKLTVPASPTFDFYGSRVAISGNDIIVGAPEQQIGANMRQGSAYIFRFSPNRAQFDFDGDGRSDFSVFRPSSGVWYLLQSTSGFAGIQFGQAGDKIVPADYDGNGKTDVAVYRAGVWYLRRSQLGLAAISFGASSDIPVPADFDGDGRADIAVYRNGTWYLSRSKAGFLGIQFGASGDIPVPADYDGDDKSELAVFRPANGTWYFYNLATNQASGIQFGSGGDKPVPADYDGDGKTDVAVFRPSDGTWYVSTNPATNYGAIRFGASDDVPVPADFDGDGKADIAVYRPSNGTWYLRQSISSFTGLAFGTAGDVPAPSAYVP